VRERGEEEEPKGKGYRGAKEACELHIDVLVL